MIGGVVVAISRKRLNNSPTKERASQHATPKIKQKDRLVTRKITYQERKSWDEALDAFDAAKKITDYSQYQKKNILALAKYIFSLKKMYKTSRIEILEDVYVDKLILLLKALNNHKKMHFNKDAEIQYAKEKLVLLRELQYILPQDDEVELTAAEIELANNIKISIQNYNNLIQDHEQEKKLIEKSLAISHAAEQASTSIVLKLTKRKTVETPSRAAAESTFFGTRSDGDLLKLYNPDHMLVDDEKTLIRQPDSSPDKLSQAMFPRLFNNSSGKIIQERNNSFCYLSSFGRLLSILKIAELDAYTIDRMPINDTPTQQAYMQKATLAEQINKEKQQAYAELKQHRFDPEAIMEAQSTELKKTLSTINMLIEKKSYLSALKTSRTLYLKFQDSDDSELIRLIVFCIIYSGDLLCAELRKKTEMTLVKITPHIQTIVDPQTELIKSDFEFIRLRKTPILSQQQPTASVLRYALLMFPDEISRFPEPEKVSDRLPVAKIDKVEAPKEEQLIKKSRRTQEKTLLRNTLNSKTNPRYYHAYVVASVLLKTNVSENLELYIDALNAEVKRVNCLLNKTSSTSTQVLAKTF